MSFYGIWNRSKFIVGMGGCQNYGPFLGPSIIGHLVLRGPKRDHNFDDHLYSLWSQKTQTLFGGLWDLVATQNWAHSLSSALLLASLTGLK